MCPSLLLVCLVIVKLFWDWFILFSSNIPTELLRPQWQWTELRNTRVTFVTYWDNKIHYNLYILRCDMPGALKGALMMQNHPDFLPSSQHYVSFLSATADVFLCPPPFPSLSTGSSLARTRPALTCLSAAASSAGPKKPSTCTFAGSLHAATRLLWW